MILISCGQPPKEEKDTKTEDQGIIDIIETTVDSLSEHNYSHFQQKITQINTKKLPYIEATNFDSFIDEDGYDDYKEIIVKALKLDSIYAHFNSDGHHFKVVALHTIPISDDFHTVLVTLLKNEHEMETVLINYKVKGEIIAHQVVAYDEIAEGMSRTVSRISENKITVNQIFWGNTKEVEKIGYEILGNGNIKKVDVKRLDKTIENYGLENGIIDNLELDWVQIKTNFIVSQVNPKNPDETIVVIPEIIDEGEQYFNLNSHIVIANNRSGKITHNYFESHKTNRWFSDAVKLDEIKIDTVPYTISEGKTAFGIRVSHFGLSSVNPYQSNRQSLFVKSGGSLIIMLSDYSIKDYGGEWDGNCDGEFINEDKSLFVSSNITNDYFDLIVNNKITIIKNFEDENGECETNKTYQNQEKVLKFNGRKYTEHDVETILFSEYQPEKLENIHIEKFDVNHAFQLEEFKIISGNYLSDNSGIANEDSETDWGDRLLVLNPSKEIIYRSHGIGDAYLFEPHFYRSDASDKIIIISQMAFEYAFGGEAFLLEKGIIKSIGTLDIEGYGEEYENYLTEIVEIREYGDVIEFTFKSNQLVLQPGSEDKVIANDNVRYVYKDNELKLEINP